MVNAISKRCVALGLFVFFSCSIYANNIQVANVTHEPVAVQGSVR